jgi:hypothetical protein
LAFETKRCIRSASERGPRVLDVVAPAYVLLIAIMDACGPRVSEREHVVGGDLDEERQAIRVRPDAEKNERYRFLHLDDDLFTALLATLPPHEDRDPDAPMFPGVTDATVRMAISRACKATGTPHFSPHSLRRRRGSLHHKRTGSLADVAELLGDSKRVASDHYVYALTDYAEVDRRDALGRLFGGVSLRHAERVESNPGQLVAGLGRPVLAERSEDVADANWLRIGESLRPEHSHTEESPIAGFPFFGTPGAGVRFERVSANRPD